MIRTKLLCLFLFVPFICEAADLKPWFGNEYEVELRATLLYQNYSSISIPFHHSIKRHANDGFITLSATYPFKRYRGEFEATAAYTQHQKGRWDNFRITGSYLWLDELEDDPLNLVTGIILTEPFSRALHDISSFHHGHIDGEFFLSYGKKYGCPCSKDYISRWWNVIGIGIADFGSPWIRGEAAWEYNFYDAQQLRVFVNTLWGIGKNYIDPHHFKGYGKIKHKSVDLGIRYGYTMGCWGTLNLEYARRVFAYNFPHNANLVLLEYYYPFGTQVYTNY